jgi:hypothetical protein
MRVIEAADARAALTLAVLRLAELGHVPATISEEIIDKGLDRINSDAFHVPDDVAQFDTTADLRRE